MKCKQEAIEDACKNVHRWLKNNEITRT